MSQRLFHIYQKPDDTAIRMLAHNGSYLIEEAEILRQVLGNLGFNPERLALPIYQNGESRIQWFSPILDLKSLEDFGQIEQRDLTRRFNEFKSKVLEALNNSSYREKFEIIFSNDLSGEEDAYAPWIWSNGDDFTIIWGAFRAKDEVTEIIVEDPPIPTVEEPTAPVPPVQQPDEVIKGCTDPSALNYNARATEDDGSCTYSPPDPPSKRGCTDPNALNFDPKATDDDGSCIYASPPGSEILGCTNPRALNYNPEATEDDGSCIYEVELGSEAGKPWPHWFWFWLILVLLLLLAVLFVGCPNCDREYSPITGERIYNPAPEILPERPNEMEPIDDEDQFSEELPNVILNRLNLYPKKEDVDFAKFVEEVVASCPDTTAQLTYWDPLTKRVQVSFDYEAFPSMKDRLREALAHYQPLIWNESLLDNMTISDPVFSNEKEGWFYEAIHFSEKHLKLGSPAITIAVIDDGFDTAHQDFAPIQAQGFNFFSYNEHVYAANRGLDQQGHPRGNNHGTHVSGICSAKANNGLGGLGLSPNCTLLPIQISDEWSEGFATSRIIDGVLFALNQGANVINLSLGSSMAKEEWEIMSHQEKQAYFEFTKDEAEFWNELYLLGESRGVVFVKAAGNSGLPMHTDLMNRSSIPIYVLATGRDGELTDFTNYPEAPGEPDHSDVVCCIAAPGTDIYSTFPQNNYELLSGTSMSAPMVSSLVALTLSQDRSLDPKQIRSILMSGPAREYDGVGHLPFLNFNIFLERANINS